MGNDSISPLTLHALLVNDRHDTLYHLPPDAALSHSASNTHAHIALIWRSWSLALVRSEQVQSERAMNASLAVYFNSLHLRKPTLKLNICGICLYSLFALCMKNLFFLSFAAFAI